MQQGHINHYVPNTKHITRPKNKHVLITNIYNPKLKGQIRDEFLTQPVNSTRTRREVSGFWLKLNGLFCITCLLLG